MTEHPSPASGEPRNPASVLAATRGQSPRRLAAWLFAIVAAFLLLVQFGPSAGAASQATASVTVVAQDFASQATLSKYNFIVNVDNTKLPGNPLALNTESNSAIVAIGNQTDNAVTLPSTAADCPGSAGPNNTGCRYLISVRARNHKMWGQHVLVTGNKTVTIDLTTASQANPLPLGKIRVFVFRDNTWTNGAPDTEEGGLNGFQVGLEEQTGSEVTVDYHNQPLCGGVCVTSGSGDDAGFVVINSLGPATYNIDVHPPAGPCNGNPNSQWYQTTTIDGGLSLQAPTEEGSDGTGAPGEQLWEPPNVRTAYWFGFVCAPQDFAAPGSGEIVGQARNWVEWAPYTYGTLGDTVENPFVALSDASTDQTVYVGQGDADGNFDIQNVPAGDYNLAVWDEQLSYIMRFKPVTVGTGETVDVNETGDDGSVGLGVSRWFGWLDGTVYKDVNGNGKYDEGLDATIGGTDVDQRWRDGSIKEGATTNVFGQYDYPTAEGGALGRWFINEQGFSRFSAFPGASIHDERDPYNPAAEIPSCSVEPPNTPAGNCIPNAEGGGLLVNQSVLEGHRSIVDWGKRDYPAGTPGQIVGITYFATTRNEFEAYKQAHEDYEPAIPDVTVYLEDTNGVVLNKYSTDHWAQPNASEDPLDGTSFTQSCNPILDFAGNPIPGLSPKIGPNCLEVPLAGAHTKEGKFDGGYAFASYCPASTGGYDLAADDGTCVDHSQQVDLVAGTYVTHAIMPTDSHDSRPCNPSAAADGYKRVSGDFSDGPSPQLGCVYHPVREEDVNVDLGNPFEPAIPQPPCAGDTHKIDQSTLTPRSTFYTGNQSNSPSTPLCDKRLVVLENGQNANADFFMMTNFITDPNGAGVGDDSRIGDVEEPGRVVGQVFNDIYFERNMASPWYGEPRPIPNLPVGIYARVDTKPNVNQPFDQDRWRLITTLKTTADGAYEVLLPSTETFNCPIPQGPCPGMYIAIVNDPGTKDHPNAGFDPNVLTANTPFEVWPGLTTQLDTPVDPISGTACEDPPGAPGGLGIDPSDPAVPDLLQVSQPYVDDTTTGSTPVITIQADFIGVAGPSGTTGGRVTLTDLRTGQVQTLTRSNGGILPVTSDPATSGWLQGNASRADLIRIRVPALSSTFRPGPKQLTIITANNQPGPVPGGASSANGITIHVRGSNTPVGGTTVTYQPTVVNVPAPTLDGHELQTAINGASAGDLLVLSPGTYNENILLWQPVRIQGLGPGGIIGAHEFQARDPEDPRFNIQGSVIDGRFHAENLDYFNTQVSNHGPFSLADAPLNVVLNGADITAVAKTDAAYNVPSLGTDQDSAAFNGARIDGLGLMTGLGQGAGGIQLMANINNLQITNNILENNGGVVAGGIGVGQVFARNSHNHNVRVANNRLIGNGGLTTSGGLGIFYGSNNYEVARNVICSNFSVEYGAGISHIGLSPSSSIHDNRIYYNDSVDSGAGIAIESELPIPNPGGALGDGSGSVNVDRNLIQSNFSGDDGGGIFVLDALDQPINIRNNMIVDNGAADMGGAIVLDDSSKVSIVNNTVADNVSTASSENSQVGHPHAAGLATEKNETAWQNDARYAAQYPDAATRPTFSNPAALFNNIFWQNNAFTLDQFGPGATLVDQGFIDFEIRGTSPASCTPSGPCDDTFTPRFSDLTAANTLSPPTATSCGAGSSTGQLLGPDGCMHTLPGGQENITAGPAFVTPFVLELAVGGSRGDPQQAAVTITGADPPVGLTGDYHVANGSPVVDRGAAFSNLAAPPVTPLIQTPASGSILAPCSGTAAQSYPADYDRDFRPQRRVNARIRTAWDMGADERPGTNMPIPGSYPQGPDVTFNWNQVGNPFQCSASTETR